MDFFWSSKQERCKQLEIKKSGRIGILSVCLDLYYDSLRELISVITEGFNCFCYLTQISIIFFLFIFVFLFVFFKRGGF
jgi:hypothetical protein